MNAKDLFNKLSLPTNSLVGQLNASTPDEFANQFRELFSQDNARKAIKVVYVWATQKQIPRLSGTSDVIYIGQTVQSLCDRHHRYTGIESSGGNWDRYNHIIQNFGHINVLYAYCENPKNTETSFLHLYFKEHLEPPPLNSIST